MTNASKKPDPALVEIFSAKALAELKESADKIIADFAPPVQAPARDERGRFPPGTSGNPNGRPRGSRNVVSQIVEQWAADNLEGLLNAIRPLAANHPAAMKMILDRITPKSWRPAPSFRFGPINSQADLDDAVNRALTAYDTGEFDQDGLSEVLERLAKIKALRAASPEEINGDDKVDVTEDAPADPA